MKKLSILLIGLLLVTGFGFAVDFAGTVSISGEASVTFGVDLNTNATGFRNAGTSTLKVTFVSKQSATKGGDDGLYGWIEFKDFELTATPAGVAGSNGAVTAKIVVSPAEIKIFTAPGFAIDKATTIEPADTNEVSVATALDSTYTPANTIGGITITVPMDPITIALKLASDGDWTNNVDNEYVIGTDLTLKVSPVTLEVALTYGWLGAAQIGVGTKADVALADVAAGLDAYVAADINVPAVGDLAWDLAVGLTQKLTAKTNVAAKVYVAPYGVDDMDLDVSLSFTEDEAEGLIEMVAATVKAELLDLLTDTLTWNVDVTGSYNTGGVKPYFGFGYGSDEVFNLNGGVYLYAAMTGIDNTTIQLHYESADVAVSNGVIWVKAAVKY